jgi:predicted dehydrogenase
VVCRRGLPALAALGQRVEGVWGRRPDRAAQVAARYGAGRAFDRFDQLLAECDAVYVATPVAAHVPLAMAALEAGRHVLVEKPLGGALKYDRDRLLAAAGGAVAAVAYYRRLAPAMLAARRALAGRGPYRAAASFRGAFAPRPADPMYWRTVSAVSGGGVLADAGSHRLDLLCWLFGPPAAVTAVLADRYPGGAERTAAVDLRWTEGSTSRLRCSWTADAAAYDSLSIVGSRVAVSLPRLDSGRMTVRSAGLSVTRNLTPDPNPLIPVLRDFLDCVEFGRTPACSLADAALVDALIRSVTPAEAAPYVPPS